MAAPSTASIAASLTARALAKVNLTLRVIRRRPDGYHDIDSLVVFARLADRVAFVPATSLSLTLRGPTASAAGPTTDNLVLKAASALAANIPALRLGAFTLHKQLPVAAGLGGGSADAAAALRLLAQANGIALDDPRVQAAAKATGADVPVCLDPRPRRMQGIGDILSAPLALPRLAAVLINPSVAVPTRDVFAALRIGAATQTAWPDPPTNRQALLAALADQPNDLEPPAIAIAPVIADVLAALRGQPGCRLARMSGSGATCFGLFDSLRAAMAVVPGLRKAHLRWWVHATVLNG